MEECKFTTINGGQIPTDFLVKQKPIFIPTLNTKTCI